MRLGIGSWTFPWAIGAPGHRPDQPLAALGLLRKSQELGVHVTQIADNLPLDRLSAGDLDQIAVFAGEHGISIEVGTRGIAPERLRAYLALARRFGSPIVRTVVDTTTHRPGIDEIVAVLQDIMPEFEREGISLAIENHDRFDARTFARLIERVGSLRLGICLDTVNSFGALEGPAVVVDTLAPYTINVHVKDFAVRRSKSSMGFVIEGRPAGQGQLDIPGLLKRLQAAGRDLSAILELWTPPGPSLSATIETENIWAQESIAYLRTLIVE